MADLIRLNGKAFDHSSFRMTIAGRRLRTMKEVKYSQKRTRAKVPGNTKSQRPIAKTSGNYEFDKLTVTVTRAEAHAVRQLLSSKSADGESYGDVEVPIVAQYVERGLPTMVDSFKKCTLETDAGGTTYGSDPHYEDLVFDADSMTRNGMHLYASDT